MTTTILASGNAWSQSTEPAPTKQPAASKSKEPKSKESKFKEAGDRPASKKNASTKNSDGSRSSETGRPYVYLLRGLLNVFSLGMDDLAAKLQRRGVANGVYEHGQWDALCQDAAARWRSSKTKIVIVGHSLGADAVIHMANRLGQMGIPVALVVAFDPVHPVPLTGSTTARFVNLYQSNNGWGAAVPRGSGFKGELSNVDLRSRSDISHTSIDKSARLHEIVISRVLGLGGRSSEPKPAAAAPRPGDIRPPSTVGAPTTAATPGVQPSSDRLRPALVSPPSRPASQTQ